MIQCQQCTFWVKAQACTECKAASEESRECRRRAPAPGMNRNEVVAFWPHTRASDGCGEGEAQKGESQRW